LFALALQSITQPTPWDNGIAFAEERPYQISVYTRQSQPPIDKASGKQGTQA
jgi:hypothetical protein